MKIIKNHKIKDLGGRPEETILLNIDTFKNLCIIAKTENGKKIRKYYYKLEELNKLESTQTKYELNKT